VLLPCTWLFCTPTPQKIFSRHSLFSLFLPRAAAAPPSPAPSLHGEQPPHSQAPAHGVHPGPPLHGVEAAMAGPLPFSGSRPLLQTDASSRPAARASEDPCARRPFLRSSLLPLSLATRAPWVQQTPCIAPLLPPCSRRQQPPASSLLHGRCPAAALHSATAPSPSQRPLSSSMEALLLPLGSGGSSLPSMAAQLPSSLSMAASSLRPPLRTAVNPSSLFSIVPVGCSTKCAEAPSSPRAAGSLFCGANGQQAVMPVVCSLFLRSPKHRRRSLRWDHDAPCLISPRHYSSVINCVYVLSCFVLWRRGSPCFAWRRQVVQRSSDVRSDAQIGIAIVLTNADWVCLW
jgi:hypothetical protein